MLRSLVGSEMCIRDSSWIAIGGTCSSSDEHSFSDADLDLIKACEQEKLDDVVRALGQGADPYCRKPTLSSKSKGRYTGEDAYFGMTPVHIAASNGSLEILEKLLAQSSSDHPSQLSLPGGNLERKGFRGTPLEHAVEGGHAEVGSRLLDSGAKPPQSSRELVRRALKTFFSDKYPREGGDMDAAANFVTYLVEREVAGYQASAPMTLAKWRNKHKQTLLHELVRNAVTVTDVASIDGPEGPLARVIRALVDIAGVEVAACDEMGNLAACLDKQDKLAAGLSALPTPADLEGHSPRV
eukprot:TRINITY_DN49642_c0_g1_i1.p1 TRINITY_DN49642_c0_g1~~TRINITY_DN49642_c0_g1_i1.p1  ORF type:complete len:297 (-),score=59.49 TRINITY_DN49642_c0_g1_i1:358-1248(-)